MVGLAFAALFCGLAVLLVLTGYWFGRAEASDEYEWQLEERQRTIDALLAPTVRIRG